MKVAKERRRKARALQDAIAISKAGSRSREVLECGGFAPLFSNKTNCPPINFQRTALLGNCRPNRLQFFLRE